VLGSDLPGSIHRCWQELLLNHCNRFSRRELAQTRTCTVSSPRAGGCSQQPCPGDSFSSYDLMQSAVRAACLGQQLLPRHERPANRGVERRSVQLRTVLAVLVILACDFQPPLPYAGVQRPGFRLHSGTEGKRGWQACRAGSGVAALFLPQALCKIQRNPRAHQPNVGA